MSDLKDIDDEIDALFEGAVMVTRDRAFRALGIQKSYGHELIDRGILERVKLGNASRITVRSIKQAARGIPRSPRREKTKPAESAAPTAVQPRITRPV